MDLAQTESTTHGVIFNKTQTLAIVRDVPVRNPIVPGILCLALWYAKNQSATFTLICTRDTAGQSVSVSTEIQTLAMRDYWIKVA